MLRLYLNNLFAFQVLIHGVDGLYKTFFGSLHLGRTAKIILIVKPAVC